MERGGYPATDWRWGGGGVESFLGQWTEVGIGGVGGGGGGRVIPRTVNSGGYLGGGGGGGRVIPRTVNSGGYWGGWGWRGVVESFLGG